jgi:phosphoribosylglycinamide formyltransferase-1
LEAIREGRVSAEVTAVVSDRAEAPVLGKARALGVRAEAFVPGPNRAETDARLSRALEDSGGRPDFLVLAGYMRVLTDAFIESYRSPRGYARIVNVHPSILPAFPGVGSYAQAFRHGSQLAGVTVHLVEPAVDDGPICAQASFPIGDCRSAEEVEARGLRLEHVLYPETLAWVLPEKFEVETRSLDINGKGLPPGRSIRRLCVRPN